MYIHVPRVGIIKADLIDPIVSGSVGPYGWMGMGVDTKQWQNGRHFLLWRLKGRKNKKRETHLMLYDDKNLQPQSCAKCSVPPKTTLVGN